jgi:hypothetical protein
MEEQKSGRPRKTPRSFVVSVGLEEEFWRQLTNARGSPACPARDAPKVPPLSLCTLPRFGGGLTSWQSALPSPLVFPQTFIVPLVLIHASPLYFARHGKRKDDCLNSPAGVQPSSVPKRRWGIALLLGFGVLVNYFDRVNLSVSMPCKFVWNFRGDVRISVERLQLDLCVAATLPSGLLLDRFGVTA